MKRGRTGALALSLVTILTMSSGGAAYAQPKKPSILVIWGDESGTHNSLRAVEVLKRLKDIDALSPPRN